MTPKKLSQKFLKRAGEIRFTNRAARLFISKDPANEEILRKIVETGNSGFN